MTARRQAARAVVLPLVLAVVVLAVSVAAGMLASASTRIDAAEATWRRQQLRAIALSGLRGAMAQLESQRDELLAGQSPSLSTELVLYADATGRGVATLLPPGDGGDLHAWSALSGLDPNRATAEMLARLPGVPESLAGKIVSGRGRGYSSVEEIGVLAVEEGLDLSAVFGPYSHAQADGESAGGVADPPLLSMLTTFAFDPEVQQGLGRDAAAARGLDRVRPTAEWIKEYREELLDRFGEPTVGALDRLATTRGAFESRSRLIGAMQAQGVPIEAWAGILDLVAVGDDQFGRGLVDLNHAPAEVLAALPGLDESIAAAIVARRGSLDDAQRGTIAWPVLEGVIDSARLAQAADWLTPRSLVWRVRVRGAIEPPPEVDAPSQAAAAGGVVLDAVIDLTGPRARLAYLREVTSMPLAVWLAERIESSAEPPIADVEEGAMPEPEAEEDTALRIERLSIRRGLSLSRPRPPARAAPAEESPPPSPSAMRDRRIGRWTPGPSGGTSERSSP